MYVANKDQIKIFNLCNQRPKTITPDDFVNVIHTEGLKVAKENLNIKTQWVGKNQVLFKNNKLIGIINPDLYETSLNSRLYHDILSNKFFGNVFLDSINVNPQILKTIKTFPVYNNEELKKFQNTFEINRELVLKPLTGYGGHGVQINKYENLVFQSPSVISYFERGIDLSCFWVGKKVVGWYSRVLPVFYGETKKDLIKEAEKLDQKRSYNKLTRMYSVKEKVLNISNSKLLPKGPKVYSKLYNTIQGLCSIHELTQIIPDNVTKTVEKTFHIHGIEYGRIDFIANDITLDASKTHIEKIDNLFFLEFNCTPNNRILSFCSTGKFRNPWLSVLKQMIINSKC